MFLPTLLFTCLTIISGEVSELLKTYRVYNTVEMKELVDKTNNMGVLGNSWAHNQIECNRRCVHDDHCLSFFYNNNNQMCQLHGRDLNVTASESTAAPGSHYYKLKRRRLVGETCIWPSECVMEHSTCPANYICSCVTGYDLHPVQKTCQTGLIGHNCTVGDNCRVEHSDCMSDGTCGCLPGYSFQRAIHTCEENCVEYGDTFQCFPGSVIWLNDDFVKPTTTLHDCQQLCLNATTYKCVSLDFYTPTGRCYHQEVDPTDVPNSYIPNPNFNFYQRNCA